MRIKGLKCIKCCNFLKGRMSAAPRVAVTVQNQTQNVPRVMERRQIHEAKPLGGAELGDNRISFLTAFCNLEILKLHRTERGRWEEVQVGSCSGCLLSFPFAAQPPDRQLGDTAEPAGVGAAP